jgi:hypothetical protein
MISHRHKNIVGKGLSNRSVFSDKNNLKHIFPHFFSMVKHFMEGYIRNIPKKKIK